MRNCIAAHFQNSTTQPLLRILYFRKRLNMKLKNLTLPGRLTLKNIQQFRLWMIYDSNYDLLFSISLAYLFSIYQLKTNWKVRSFLLFCTIPFNFYISKTRSASFLILLILLHISILQNFSNTVAISVDVHLRGIYIFHFIHSLCQRR